MVGTPFGRYLLIELLGRGGMGEVWRAYDTQTNNRTVAIKLLPPHLADDTMFAQRFRREADAAARLNNPHIIPIHTYGEIDGRLYVDMRLIEGRDLQAVIAEGPLEPGRAVRIIEQVAKALHAAHKIGLVHRDVKPSNILVDDDDFAYLIDFGIARAADETRLTGTGNTIGTFHYMAPERLADHPDEDARADIYALACVLYECLTGRPPFAGASLGSLVAAHLHTAPPKPSSSQPNIPTQVDAVIATGMAKQPDQRYATTIELASAAHDAITTPTRLPPPTVAPPVQPPTQYVAQNRFATPPPQPTFGQRVPPPSGPDPRAPSYQPPRAPQPPAAPVARQPLAAPVARQHRNPLWRRKSVVFPVAAVIAVAVVAVVVFATTNSGGGPAESTQTSSARPTSTAQTSAAQTSAAQTSAAQTSTAAPRGPQAVLPFTGLDNPHGVAVDGAGNVYVSDNGNNRVVKLLAAGNTQSDLAFTGIERPVGVVVDAAGDVYVADASRVLKLAATSGAQTTLPFTVDFVNFPVGVAVSAAGDVLVTRGITSAVLELAAGSGSEVELPFTGLSSPYGVAVDAAGNVYVVDKFEDRVVMLAAGSSTQTVLPFTGLSFPSDVEVDAAGNVYVADLSNNRVVALEAGSSTQTVLPFEGLSAPSGVAVDTAGNVYVADGGNNRVVSLPPN